MSTDIRREEVLELKDRLAGALEREVELQDRIERAMCELRHAWWLDLYVRRAVDILEGKQ